MLKHNQDGTIDLESAIEAAGSCGVYVEQPNPIGLLDGGITQLKEIIGKNTALIVGVQPVSLGVVEAPGKYGADIVVGEPHRNAQFWRLRGKSSRLKRRTKSPNR